LGAERYERSESRIGQANGFKNKPLHTRVGEISLRIPQVRNLPKDSDGFYPKALEKGIRSERALKLALAEMYIHGGFDPKSDQDHRRVVWP
jgi:transposase-like protein